jgi:hypothetical protein
MDIPEGWYTAAGKCLWGEAKATYKFVPAEALPSVPGPLDGTFAWLRAAVGVRFGMRYGSDERGSAPPPNELEARVAEARHVGLSIPDEFITLMRDEELLTRVPSCTACYWELGAHLLPLPDHEGPERLLRFMNDQQSCVLWYLLLEPGRRHRVVAAFPRLGEDLNESAFEGVDSLSVDEPIPFGVCACSPSFEEFVRRFWIENAIWCLAFDGKPLNAELTAYLDAVKSAAAQLPE